MKEIFELFLALFNRMGKLLQLFFNRFSFYIKLEILNIFIYLLIHLFLNRYSLYLNSEFLPRTRRKSRFGITGESLLP